MMSELPNTTSQKYDIEYYINLKKGAQERLEKKTKAWWTLEGDARDIVAPLLNAASTKEEELLTMARTVIKAYEKLDSLYIEEQTKQDTIDAINTRIQANAAHVEAKYQVIILFKAKITATEALTAAMKEAGSGRRRALEAAGKVVVALEAATTAMAAATAMAATAEAAEKEAAEAAEKEAAEAAAAAEAAEKETTEAAAAAEAAEKEAAEAVTAAEAAVERAVARAAETKAEAEMVNVDEGAMTANVKLAVLAVEWAAVNAAQARADAETASAAVSAAAARAEKAVATKATKKEVERRIHQIQMEVDDEAKKAAAQEEAPFAIGSPVYVKRTNGTESIAVVKNYNANSKLYDLELDGIEPKQIKRSLANNMRGISLAKYEAIQREAEELRNLDDDERRKEELEYQARLRGTSVGIGALYTSLRSKVKHESKATMDAQRRLTRSRGVFPDPKTKGGTNTKKYRRRNKRKTKHYKKKTKRYTKKRNMRY